MAISPAQVAHARELLRRHFPPTRLAAAPSLGPDVYLKLETELPTGSFKVRGALVALSRRLERGPVSEVVASSTGNHGAAVAYAARLLGVPATIFVPSQVNPTKRERIVDAGARIVEEGRDIADAFVRASAYATRDGVHFLNDATDPDLPAGPATIACEILEQLPATRTMYVPVGDTALIRGMATAAKQASPDVRMIGVQASGAPSYYLSWKEGQPHPTQTCATIADGLARTPEEANVRAIRDLVDEMALVSDEEMLAAIRHLLLQEHVVAEPAGAAATAAFMQRRSTTGPTVLLVSGANVALEVLQGAVR